MTADQARGETVPAPGDARLFIGGEYVASRGERFEVVSPVTGAVIGTVPVPGPDEVDAAVAAARAAQRAWARVNVWERAKACHAIGDGITARRDALARLQTLEQGRSPSRSPTSTRPPPSSTCTPRTRCG